MARANSSTNPSCDNNTTDWLIYDTSGASGVPTRVTGQTVASTGKTTAGSVAVGAAAYAGSIEGGPVTTSAFSTTWSVVGWVMASVARTVAPDVVSYNGSTFVAEFAGQSNMALSASTWTQTRFTFTTPASGAFTRIRLNINCPTSGTACTLYLAAVRFEQVSDAALTFADGSTTGWQWDGTAGNSTSQQTTAGAGFEPGRFLIAV